MATIELGLQQLAKDNITPYDFETEDFGRRLKIPLLQTALFKSQREALPLQIRRSIDLHITKAGMAPGSPERAWGDSGYHFRTKCKIHDTVFIAYYFWKKPDCKMVCFTLEIE